MWLFLVGQWMLNKGLHHRGLLDGMGGLSTVKLLRYRILVLLRSQRVCWLASSWKRLENISPTDWRVLTSERVALPSLFHRESTLWYYAVLYHEWTLLPNNLFSIWAQILLIPCRTDIYFRELDLSYEGVGHHISSFSTQWMDAWADTLDKLLMLLVLGAFSVDARHMVSQTLVHSKHFLFIFILVITRTARYLLTVASSMNSSRLADSYFALSKVIRLRSPVKIIQQILVICILIQRMRHFIYLAAIHSLWHA